MQTRDLLKVTAQRLFAERGIDGVGLRDIVSASGQRNAASVHYHFGSKEALVRELIVDGASRIDAHRNAALDALEARSPQPALREVIDVLVRTAYPPAHEDEGHSTFLRFLLMLQANHRDLFMDTLGGQLNRGFQRVINHLKRLLADMPAPVLTQRLVLLGVYSGASLATREAALDAPAETAAAAKKTATTKAGTFWRNDVAIENLVDTLTAMLASPPSEATLRALAR